MNPPTELLQLSLCNSSRCQVIIISRHICASFLRPLALAPCLTGLLLSQCGQSHGRWSRRTAAHLARPNGGKGTRESTWPHDKEHYVTMIKYKNTPHTPCRCIFTWIVRIQMVFCFFCLLVFLSKSKRWFSRWEKSNHGKEHIIVIYSILILFKSPF